jgi:protein-arginine kinase activator protein McsA
VNEGRKLTTEEQLWLALADAEKDLANASKKLFDLHNDLRKYELFKVDGPMLDVNEQHLSKTGELICPNCNINQYKAFIKNTFILFGCLKCGWTYQLNIAMRKK